MGSLCASQGKSLGTSMMNSLIGQYGESNILNYAQSSVGNNVVSQQFSTLRNAITQKFNSSSQGSSNQGLLNQILGQVNNVEAQQKQNLNSIKPSIPELDNASTETQNSFMKAIESKFGSQISSYKSNLLSSLAPQLDPSKYLKQFGL